MNSNPADVLKKLKPEKDFFIGIDSDGCVFDTMEIKQKECFCPQFINHFGLQSVSKYARETWEFVNLYSKTRGINRFKALIKTMDLLSGRKEIKERNLTIPELKAVKEWVSRETKLGDPALKIELEKNPDKDLKITFEWSLDVNETIKKIVRNVPPFPYVKETLSYISQKADLIVVSQTPGITLEREWKEHKIENFVKIIAGQEMGTKIEHIDFASKGKYQKDHVLMIGDAPGDYEAAKKNGSLFFPIIPGKEEESWKLFYKESMYKFFNKEYAGKYEEELINKFDKYLPADPPWEA